MYSKDVDVEILEGGKDMSEQGDICMCNYVPFVPLGSTLNVWVGGLGHDYLWKEVRQIVEELYLGSSDNIFSFCLRLGRRFEKTPQSKGVLVVVKDRSVRISTAYASGEVREDADVKFELYKLMGF